MTIVYLAGNTNTRLYMKHVKYGLRSFYYEEPDSIKMYYDNGMHVFLDCGAFSFLGNNKTDKQPDIENYCTYCHTIKDWVDVYANMDVIDDPEKTLENQDVMDECGLNSMPVFHKEEDFKYLEHYLKNYDYIGLGGVSDVRGRDSADRWMHKVMEYVVDLNPTVKIHAFAVTSNTELIKYRFYSADSSTFVDGFRYNKFQKYKGRGKVYEVDVHKSQNQIGFHYGDAPLNAKIEFSLIAWNKVVEFAKSIVPSSEEPFTKKEIESI